MKIKAKESIKMPDHTGVYKASRGGYYIVWNNYTILIGREDVFYGGLLELEVRRANN